MKKFFILSVLLISSGMFLSIQAKTNPEGKIKMSDVKSGEKTFYKHADECLALIEEAAQKISIQGVAILAYIPGEVTNSWISKMKVVGHLTDAKNNLLGIASTKASEMADTHLDSGSGMREIYSGELGYKGGLIKKVKSGYILAVFSGGKSEQDLEVAKTGLDRLRKYY
jgi:hypothetical protein